MTATTWNKARSDFNHAWLKNRLLVALAKAQKVLDGSVQDESIWEELAYLLAEWPEKRANALSVLQDYGLATNRHPQNGKTTPANVEDEVSAFLSEVSHQRWTAAERPEEKCLETMLALDEMNLSVKVTQKRLKNEPTEMLQADIATLQTTARSLAAAFSKLSPPNS